MNTKNVSGLFAAITTACCLGLLSGCAGSDSDSRPAGNLADTEGEGDEQEDDDVPVDQDDTDAEPSPDPQDDDSETDGGETGGVGGETGTEGGETGDEGDETDGETDGETTGDEPPMAELDGDSEVSPAVRAQFRATSPGPVSLDAPIFNDEAIDTRGLQYQGEVSNPGDQHDFVMFNIVPGQVDPYIHMLLDCGQPGLGSDSVRAHLFHEDGTLLDTVVCGDDEQQILLEGASSNTEYLVRIEVPGGREFFDTYSLEINGYCFQECSFQPYGG